MTAWRVLRQRVTDRPVLADTLLAVALFAAANLAQLSLPAPLRPGQWPVMLAWSASGLATVAIRRRWPWLAVLALSAHTVAATAVGMNSEGVAILVLTYTAAAHLPIRSSALAAALLWVPGMAVATAWRRYAAAPLELTFVTFFLFNVMLALVAYLAGRTVFTRRRYVAALVERARTAEQNQRALAEQAVQDERRRIARELHDMVAHHVSVMGVLATGSRRLLRRDPDTADEALATIEDTSRTALREMRRLLDVLRTATEPAQPLAPQPDLTGLAALVEQVREAGLRVSLSSPALLDGGTAGTINAGVALTVYRIAQEALTNVLKHGGPDAAAEVRLELTSGWLTLEVFDTGRGPQRTRTQLGGVGHGLLGMRERVALYGGTLRTGPRPGGGFRVYARIPLEEAAHA